MTDAELKFVILDTVSDLISDFLYYDRKGDETLPQGLIDQAVATGTITLDELVQAWSDGLKGGLDIPSQTLQ